MKLFKTGAVSGAVALGLIAVPLASATENPFEMRPLSGAFQLAADEISSQSAPAAEGKGGEGKCGASMGMPEGMCGGMMMDAEGMVMNSNTDELPKDCAEISEDVEITVKTGTEYAAEFNGTIFGFDQHEWQVKPCTRLTVTFINEDDVRHQWMVHNLPSYLYPQGMFHMEVNGGYQKTGTFIVPSSDKTYLVHCDIAQHMEKGMKAQLKVGKGSGDLPSIPGITGARYPDY